ncbi:MAG TPA: M28 family peptidase [Pirellulales bacterium]|jgi:Zn-dependent M28 family amino/carboxypeptidase|nr:M28 family peptidase [Pirellulales bacterium]
MLRFPGSSYRGPLPPASERERQLHAALADDVNYLATQIGQRHLGMPRRLGAAADYIEGSLAAAGFAVERQVFDARGSRCANLIAELPGNARSDRVWIVGAHYDTVVDCPGANDNSSGVAAVLALARLWAAARPACTLRLVAFANEEAPYFGDPQMMGSWLYARRCRQRQEQVAGMLSLETIGYYCDEPGSQRYPPPLGLFYPPEGNFIGFVGNLRSRQLVRSVIAAFRRHARFPSEGAALPQRVPGVGWSDHWAFWQEGYSALMVTDTAPFRYPYYHTPQDTPDKLDFGRMARVVAALSDVVLELAGTSGA